MGIVRLALRRPYTFIVMGLMIAVLGILSVLTMSTDIFSDINIPVISVVWTYGGISPQDMENRGDPGCREAHNHDGHRH